MVNPYKIALVGNPNVGKSTIFNVLCKAHQHTGNWPGKTVDQAIGTYNYKDKDFEVVDLPGTYSLYASSYEEVITRDYICFDKYDLLIVVCDASLLERNLYLLLQILEVSNRVVVCINLVDEATKDGTKLYINKLKNIIHVPVVLTSATKQVGLNDLKDTINRYVNKKESINEFKIDYGIYEKDITNIENMIDEKYINRRFLAIKLLEGKELGEKISELVHLKNKSKDLSEKFTKRIIKTSEIIANEVVSKKISTKNHKIDKILTHKIYGNMIMLGLLCLIFYITIFFANYVSAFLSGLFSELEIILLHGLNNLQAPFWIIDILINNIYKIVSIVISVMLPPMAIFFPIFTLLEDIGYLPRIAFNVDYYFQRVKAHGKQALCMCMGLGCNVVGVSGCRIIDSPKERLLAILTNSFIPCNGRFPMVISIISMFIVLSRNPLIVSIVLLGFVFLSLVISLLATKILSEHVIKGKRSSFILELPAFRRPCFMKVIIRSIVDKSLKVMSRAVVFVVPMALLLYFLNHFLLNGEPLITHLVSFLNPLGLLLGMDGIILLAFIFGFSANEMVLPIIIMLYMKNSTISDLSISNLQLLLISNGWNLKVALCTLVFTLMHFPCINTMIVIYKETLSKKYTMLAFLLPLIVGIIMCFMINTCFYIIG